MATKPSQLTSAIHKALGFTLIETILVVGGLSAMAAGSFAFYQYSQTQSEIRAEQEHVQALATNSHRVQGILGTYDGYATSQAIASGAVDHAMIQGGSLFSRWSTPVSIEPASIAGRANAGLKITYEAVPARACAKFVQAAADGMYGVEVGQVSVLDRGVLQTGAVIERCSQGADVAFTYYGGSTALSGTVLAPVVLPPRSPPSAPPPPAIPPAPVPAPPASPPPSSPGCGAAPSVPATGTTPPGQTCSFVWNSAPYPACWTSMPLCAPVNTPPASCPPAPAVPFCRRGWFNNYQYQAAPLPTCWTLAGGCVAPPVSPPVCVAPPAVVVPETRTEFCPSGSFTPTGGSTYTQTRDETTTYRCPDPFVPTITSEVTHSAWIPDIPPCVAAPACVAPAATSVPITRALTPEARNTCPAGWTGSTPESRTRTENGTRTTSWTCPAPTGSATSSTSDAWLGTINYGAWAASAPNTCVAPPVSPPTLDGCWIGVDSSWGPGMGTPSEVHTWSYSYSPITAGPNSGSCGYGPLAQRACTAADARDEMPPCAAGDSYRFDAQGNSNEGYSTYECVAATHPSCASPIKSWQWVQTSYNPGGCGAQGGGSGSTICRSGDGTNYGCSGQVCNASQADRVYVTGYAERGEADSWPTCDIAEYTCLYE